MSHKSFDITFDNQPWENTIKIEGEWCAIVSYYGGVDDVRYYPAGYYMYNVVLPACIPQAQIVRYIRRVHNL